MAGAEGARVQAGAEGGLGSGGGRGGLAPDTNAAWLVQGHTCHLRSSKTPGRGGKHWITHGNRGREGQCHVGSWSPGN